MIESKSYNGQCWLCGSENLTSEHIYKRTDFKREFGKVPDTKIIRRIGTDKQLAIQSANSDFIKFKKSICSNCNNSKTQNFDLAYTKFQSYFKKEEKNIFESQVLNFVEIFGLNWISQFDNLIKYYVKHICCRLVDSNIEILPDLIGYLNNESELVSLKINFCLRSDIFHFLNEVNDNYGYLGLEPLYGDYSKSNESWHYLNSAYIYRGLVMHYQYSRDTSAMNSNLIFAPEVPLMIIDNPKYDKMK